MFSGESKGKFSEKRGMGVQKWNNVEQKSENYLGKFYEITNWILVPI